MKGLDYMQSFLASRKGHLAGFILMYLLLTVEYYRFVYRNYQELMGFDLAGDAVTIVVGLAMVAMMVWVMFFLPGEDNGLYAVSMIVALLYCLPAIVMYQIGGTSVFVPLYSILFFVLLRVPLKLKSGQWTLPRIPVRWQRYVLPGVCLLCLLPFPLAYGWHLDFSLFGMGTETYAVREAVSAKGNLLTAYLLGPLRMVLLPMLIVYGLTDFRKSWWMTLAGVVGMLFLFLLNPQKSIFFAVAVVLMMFLFKSHYAKAGLILYGLAGACVASVLLNVATGHLMAESIVVRRLFFIPVLVSDNYFAFFDGNPMYLSHSFLRHWFDYPYDMEPSRMIGYVMYDRLTTNCNTGIVADGFMNFGHPGAIVFVLLGALFVRCVEWQMDNARFFGLLALLVFTFLNSALFTTLLTHGGLVLLLAACFLIPKTGQEQ
ncbi:MAG: hypothetical protein J6W95_02385 [Bacteroidales bacterium]|nr:hypothetical protein [Bacteroidales bacterium]